MKHLQQYVYWVFEDQSNTELRKQIINYVSVDKKDPKDINDISDESLKRAYQILQKISEEDFDIIKNMYKGNSEGLKHLIHILENTGQKSEFLKALVKKDGFPTFNDLQSYTNLYDLAKDKKFKISEIFNDDTQLSDFLQQLLTVTYKVSGKGVGAGELFLTTLFQNTGHPNQGDVKMENNEIEVKFSTSFSSNGGRILPAKGTLKTVDEMTTEFEKMVKDKGIEIPKDIIRNNNDCIMIAGQQYIDNIINKLQDKFDNKNEIYQLLAQMYFFQFNNLKKYKDKFNNFIKTIKDYSFDTLIKIHGLLALISYHEADGWNYLLVGVSKTGDYCIINGEDCTIDNFDKLINNDNLPFVFKKYPSNTNGAHPMQDKVCQIYVSKNR